MTDATPNNNELHDCSGCTDRNSEGTHAMHTKQHPCPEGGDPNCGYCFPEQFTPNKDPKLTICYAPRGVICQAPIHTAPCQFAPKDPMVERIVEEFEKEFVFETAKWPKTIGRQPAQHFENWLTTTLLRFKEEVEGEMIKAIDAELNRVRCAACDGAKCEHTLGCQSLHRLRTLSK